MTEVSRHRLLIALALASTSTMSGVIYGFQAIIPLLVKDNVYADQCHDLSPTPCHNQTLQLNWAFALSTTTSALIILPAGLILDTHGPKRCFIIGTLSLLLGSLCFINDFFTLAFMLIANAGPFLFISCMHISEAFPEYSGIYIAALNGALDSSTMIYFILSTFMERMAMSSKALIIIHTIISIALAIPTICIMPWGSFENESYSINRLAEESINETKYSILADSSLIDIPTLKRRTSMLPSLICESIVRVQKGAASPAIKSPNSAYASNYHHQAQAMIFISLSTCIFMLRINMYINTIHILAQSTTDPNLILKVFNIALPVVGIGIRIPITLVSIPIIGSILKASQIYPSFALLLVLTTLFNLTQFSSLLTVQIIGIFLFASIRPLFYSSMSFFIMRHFRSKSFGKIYGCVIAIAGLINLAQYPIIDNAINETSGFFWSNVGFLAMFLGWSAFPACLRFNDAKVASLETTYIGD